MWPLSAQNVVQYTWNLFILLTSVHAQNKTIWVCVKWVGNLLNKVSPVEIISKKRLASNRYFILVYNNISKDRVCIK